jgi:hypothetical protein
MGTCNVTGDEPLGAKPTTTPTSRSEKILRNLEEERAWLELVSKRGLAPVVAYSTALQRRDPHRGKKK